MLVVLVDEANAGGTPCEDQERRPLAGTMKPSSGTVSDDDIRSPCVGEGGGVLSPSVVAGRLLPVDVADAPTLSVGGLRSVPSRILVVLVDGTMAEGTPGRECPREERDLRLRAGVTRPTGVSVGGGGAGSPCVGGTLSYLDVAGRLLPVVPAGGSSPVGPVNPAGPDDLVDAGGPIGPCEALSSLFHEVREPLEHSVLDHAGPAGRHVAVGPVGPLGTLSPSDCHPAGPAGPYVAGGPVGPYETLNKVLEPLEHSVLDHADPAGQHAVIQEVLEPLEHSVPDAALDGGPMEEIPVLDPLEHSVLEMALDGGLLEEMSVLEPIAHSVLSVALDGRPMEGDMWETSLVDPVMAHQ